MKVTRKRRGTTFLEIVLALSILGVIMGAVFNNIYFSIKQNNEVEKRQQNSIAAQMVHEELKNINDFKFQEMMKSLGNSNAFDFMKNEYDEITNRAVKNAVKDSAQAVNTFKIYKKKDSNIFIKIAFEDLDKTKDSYGLDKEFAVVGTKPGGYVDWKDSEICDMLISIKNDGTNMYKVAIRKLGEMSQIEYTQMKLDEIFMKITLESGVLEVKNMGEFPVERNVSANEVSVYISNETSEEIPITMNNKQETRILAAYVDQKTFAANGGKIVFSSFGENIKVYSNDVAANPFGDRIHVKDVCKYSIQVYNLTDGNYKEAAHIEGYKKFKRFEK